LKRIGFLRVSPRTDASLLHETRHTPMDTMRNAGNFVIARRSHSQECQFTIAIFYIHSIQVHKVNMRIEIQGIAKALNEADGAAASLAV
jgi:hypothetical protein